MATLALAVAGAAAGSALLPTGITVLGATFTGAMIGGQVGALAGSYVDQALLGGHRQRAGVDLGHDAGRFHDALVGPGEADVAGHCFAHSHCGAPFAVRRCGSRSVATPVPVCGGAWPLLVHCIRTSDQEQ